MRESEFIAAQTRSGLMGLVFRIVDSYVSIDPTLYGRLGIEMIDCLGNLVDGTGLSWADMNCDSVLLKYRIAKIADADMGDGTTYPKIQFPT